MADFVTSKAPPLLPLIYEAAADAALWEPFLAAFLRAMNSTIGMFWISRIQPRRLILSVSAGLSPETMAAVTDPSYRDPWLSRVDFNAVPVGTILRSNEICPDDEVVLDEIYQRVCIPARAHYGGGVTLELTATVAAGMAINRPREDGPLTDDELALWRFLIPHLRAAVGVYTRQHKLANERDALLRYFDDVGHGVVLASASNEVLASNRQARAILDRADCLRLDRGSLAAVDPDSARALKQAIHVSGGGMASPAPVQLVLNRRDGSPGLLATVLPVGRPGDVHVAVEAASAVIYLVDLGEAGALDPAPLRELYGFSEAEARVACLVATGLSVSEAAEQSHVSIHTVRSHLQRGLEKAGVNRQAELAVLVLKICRAHRA